MLCPCVRRVRTGQLAVVGGYCADLRERCWRAPSGALLEAAGRSAARPVLSTAMADSAVKLDRLAAMFPEVDRSTLSM